MSFLKDVGCLIEGVVLGFVVDGWMMYVCIEGYRSAFCRGGKCRFLGRALCPRSFRSGEM